MFSKKRLSNRRHRAASAIAPAAVSALEPLESRLLFSGYDLTTLSQFSNEGLNPLGTLVADSYGDLFGATNWGGSNNEGTVFEIVSGSNTITTLVSFNGTDGGRPDGGLAIDSAGNLFGVTDAGGVNNDGTVFEIARGTTNVITLVSFNGANGAGATGITLDSSGDLFGTTAGGGDLSLVNGNGAGTVFEIAAGTNVITTLGIFNGFNGSSPNGVTLDSSGNLFGTTYWGGSDYSSSNNGQGTVFEIFHGTSTITTLASFNITNGAYPTATVAIDSNGDLFGTTYENGGANNEGTVFEIVQGSNVITTLASFNAATGTYPNGVTLDSNGNIFGSTFTGGADGDGTVFEIVHGSGSITTIASFNYVNGRNATAGVILDSSGDLFGAAEYGGPDNNGTAFEIPHGSGTINVLASFVWPNGTDPTSGVTIDSSGDLFGTTSSGGIYGDGTVFEILHGTTTITLLGSFDGSNGESPTGVILDSNGNLFGATNGGGANGEGTIFEIVPGTTSITTLASFNGPAGGEASGLTIDSSGDIFGTTFQANQGGLIIVGPIDNYGDGTVFELAHGASTISTLASFNGIDGYGPESGVVLDSRGDIFGTTFLGGTNDLGTIFEIAHGTNEIVTLAVFNGTNGADPTGVTLDSNGNLFGATSNGNGTVFELSRGSTTIVTLASFNANYGSRPLAGVVLDSNGDIFGTTYYVGSIILAGLELGDITGLEPINTSNDNGTVFELPAGSETITTLVTFNGPNGSEPAGGLALDSSGDLFGDTSSGGDPNGGTVFELSPANPLLARVKIAQQPHNTFTGSDIGPVIVKLKDSSGNLLTSDDSPITLQVASGPGDLTGTIIVSAVNGIATFSQAMLDQPGAYTLTATQDNIVSAPSAAFTITGPAKLKVARQPGNTVAGQNIAPAILVKVKDAFGNLVTSAATDVTLEIASGPAGATLGGTDTVAAVDGIADFSDIVLTTAGTYVLKAVAGSLAFDITASFTIIPAAPARLAFLQQPADTTTDALLSPISVEVLDAFGNVCVNSRSVISLSILNGPGGTNIVPTTGGIATFNHLIFLTPGTYTFLATAGKISAISNSFTVSQRQISR